MTQKIVSAALVLLALTGCSINQTVKPVEQFAGKEICIVENTAVRESFLSAYKKALDGKGFITRKVTAESVGNSCPIVSTYSANWRWDLAMYLAYAEIKVYNNGQPSGEAIYDAMGGGGNPGKFISADNKVTELVAQLFPFIATVPVSK